MSIEAARYRVNDSIYQQNGVVAISTTRRASASFFEHTGEGLFGETFPFR